jgi:hypothetical protein
LNEANLIGALYIGRDIGGVDGSHDDFWLPLHPGFEPPVRRDPVWTPDGLPGHPFFRVVGIPHEASLDGQRVHPWVDFFYPMGLVSTALARLASNPNRLIHQGPAEMIFVRRGPDPAPLLVTPNAGLVVGLGMFPGFPADDIDRSADVMLAYARDMLACGGKRYLSGYFGRTEVADWATHYGNAWSGFCAAKSQHDPLGRFGSNLVRWR